MIVTKDLPEDVVREWFLLPYYERVKFFDKLRELTECASYVKLRYGRLGFYADYGDIVGDDLIIVKVGYSDVHIKDMSLQYQALCFISCLDTYLSDAKK